MIIKGAIVNDKEVIRRIKEMTPNIHGKLQTTVASLTIKLQAYVMRRKLSGQVLHIRSGRLIRSIDQVMYVSGTTLTGQVSTDVEYARKHEYGFKGTETVKAHLRTSKLGNKFPVRSFERDVNYPERSFMRSSLREMAPEIAERIDAAVGEAL